MELEVYCNVDFVVSIKKDNKVFCKLGGKHTAYDDIMWWQLEKLVKILEEGFESKEDLVEKVESETEYLHLTCDEYDADCEIDLDNQTVVLPFIPLYRPEDVCKEECCIDLKVIDGKYYAVYDVDDEYPMTYVYFEKEELLDKKNVSMNEFKEITTFINNIINEYNDTDFVLNDKFILRFNFAC